MARQFGDRIVRPGSREDRANRRKPKPVPAPRGIPIFRKPTQPGTPAATRRRRFEVARGQTQQRVRIQRERAAAELGRHPTSSGQRHRAAARTDQRTLDRQRTRRSYRPDLIAQLLAGQSPGLPGGAGVPGLTARQAQAVGQLGLARREYAAAAKPDSLAGELLNPVDLAIAVGTGGGSLLAKGALRAGARTALAAGAERAGAKAGARTLAQRIAAGAGRSARGGIRRGRGALTPKNIRAASYTRGTRAGGTAAALAVAGGAAGQQALTALPIDVAAHGAAFKQHPGRYIERTPGSLYGILAGLGTAAVNPAISAGRAVSEGGHRLGVPLARGYTNKQIAAPTVQAAKALGLGTLEAAKLYGSADYKAVKKHAGETGGGELLALGLPLGHASKYVRPFKGKATEALRSSAERFRAERTHAHAGRVAAGTAKEPKTKAGKATAKILDELGLGRARTPASATREVLDIRGRPATTGERIFLVNERRAIRKRIAEGGSTSAVFERSVHDRLASRMVKALENLRVPKDSDVGTLAAAVPLIVQKISVDNPAKAIDQLAKIVNRASPEVLADTSTQAHAAQWLLEELHDNPNFIRDTRLNEAVDTYRYVQQVRQEVAPRVSDQVAEHTALKPIMFEHGVPPAEARVSIEEPPPLPNMPTGTTGRPGEVLDFIKAVEDQTQQQIRHRGPSKPGGSKPTTVKLRAVVEKHVETATSAAAKLHDEAGTLYKEAGQLDELAKRPTTPSTKNHASAIAKLRKKIDKLRADREAAEQKPPPAVSIPTTRAGEAPAPAEPTTPRLPPGVGGSEWHPVPLRKQGVAIGAYVRRAERFRKKARKSERDLAHTDFEVVGITPSSYKLQPVGDYGNVRIIKHAELEAGNDKWQELKPGPAPKEKVERRKLPAAATEGPLGEAKARVHPDPAEAAEDFGLFQRRLERDAGVGMIAGYGRELGIEHAHTVEDIFDELIQRTPFKEADAEVAAYAYLGARDALTHDTGPVPRANADFYERLRQGDTAPEVQEFAYAVDAAYRERGPDFTDYQGDPFATTPEARAPKPMEGPPRIKDKRFENPVKKEGPVGPLEDAETDAWFIEQRRQNPYYVEPERMGPKQGYKVRSRDPENAPEPVGTHGNERDAKATAAHLNEGYTAPPAVEQPTFEGEVREEKPTYGAGEKHEASGLFTPTENLKGQTGLTDSELGLESGKPGGLFARTGEAPETNATTRAGEAPKNPYQAEQARAAWEQGYSAGSAGHPPKNGARSPQYQRGYDAGTAATTPATLEGRGGTPLAPETPAGAVATAAVEHPEVAAIDVQINALEAEVVDLSRRQADAGTLTKEQLRSEAKAKRERADTAKARARLLDKRAKNLSGQLGKPHGDAEYIAAINDASVIRKAEEIGEPAYVHLEDAIKLGNEAGIPFRSGGKRGGGSRIYQRGETLEKLGSQDSTFDVVWGKSMTEPLGAAALEHFQRTAAEVNRIANEHYTVADLAEGFQSGRWDARKVVVVPTTLAKALREGRREDAANALGSIRPGESTAQAFMSAYHAMEANTRAPAHGEPTFELWHAEGWKEYQAQLDKQLNWGGKWNRAQAAAVLVTSLAWVPYQLVAEGLPLLASVPPHRWVKLAREFKRLDPASQALIDAYHGQYGFGFGLGRPDLRLRLRPGQPEALRLSHSAFGRTALGQALRAHKNPFAWLRTIDAWKGEQFRNIMALNHMHKAMDGFWKNARRFDELQQQILEGMKDKPFEEQARWYTRQPELMEETGRVVKDMLGDWSTLTRRERVASSLVFFYNMLRYTTRFVFWTFPKHHPLKAAIVYWLGNQNTNNVRRLLGGEPAYISALMQSVLYTGADPNDPGQVGFLNVARASPGGQALIQSAFKGPFSVQTLGLLQPAAGIAVAGLLGTDPYSGQELLPEQAVAANGYVLQADGSGKAYRGLNGLQKGLLVLSQIARLPSAVRNLEDSLAGGRQTGKMLFSGPRKSTTPGQFSKFYGWALPSGSEKLKASIVPGMGATSPLRQRSLGDMQRSLDQIKLATEAAKKPYYRDPAHREEARKIVEQARLAQHRITQLLQLPAKHGG